MRLSCKIDIKNRNTLFVNIDIYNVLDAMNPAVLQSGTSRAPVLAYEVGRQFWLELGYRL